MLDPNHENTIPTNVRSGSGETVPTRVSSTADTIAIPAVPAKKKRARRWPFILLGIALFIAITGLGGYLGFQAALDLRRSREAEASVTRATEYYMLGVQAQKNQNYDLARRYFEATIKIDSQFPGASDRLVEVLAAQMATATPTPEPTATPIIPTATPDVRSQEEKLSEARTQYAAQDWDTLFVTIDSLRTIDPYYHAVEVDGMLYMALRYRGVRKIFQDTNLESGMYDLALAEKISPLDNEAIGARNAARAYLNAISFWGADWARVISMLEPVASAMPNMRDPSGLTAAQRYQMALSSYADALMAKEKYCDAAEYYQKAIDAGVRDLETKKQDADKGCHPPTETPSATQTPTPTVTLDPNLTPTVESPTEAPPTETPTP